HRQQPGRLHVERERPVATDLGDELLKLSERRCRSTDGFRRFGGWRQHIEQASLRTAVLRQRWRLQFGDAVDERLEAQLLKDTDHFRAAQVAQSSLIPIELDGK